MSPDAEFRVLGFALRSFQSGFEMLTWTVGDEPFGDQRGPDVYIAYKDGADPHPAIISVASDADLNVLSKQPFAEHGGGALGQCGQVGCWTNALELEYVGACPEHDEEGIGGLDLRHISLLDLLGDCVDAPSFLAEGCSASTK